MSREKNKRLITTVELSEEDHTKVVSIAERINCKNTVIIRALMKRGLKGLPSPITAKVALELVSMGGLSSKAE